jgi:serine/threonine protein kinase
MREVASALAFLHGTGCVHGDLKPENLMLSTKHASDSVVKLIDFGCAQLSGREDIPATDVKTEAYCPPEVLRRDTERLKLGTTGRGRNNSSATRDRMDPSMDMWALGIILYIMLTGFHPFDFEGNSSDQVIARRIMNSTPFPVGEDSKYTAHLSESAIDLILKLLAWDPDDRLTAAEMLDHPWVRGETARTDKIADSHTKLSKFRAFKSGLEVKVFSDLYNWSEESAANATKKTSLIERSFKSFDEQEKGFITRKDLSRQLQSNTDADDSDDDGLTLSNFEDLLSESMKNKYFRKGQVVYREGEEGNEMFFINSGVVEISTHDGFKLQLKQGDFVGEGALLSQNRTRCATVTCVTPVHVIEITREYFEKYLMASFQDINLKIREKNKSRALTRTKAILRQQKELKPLQVGNGDTLYIVGDDGNELFILEKGKVDIRAHDGTTVFTVNRGDLFGERAVVANRPRTTSAVCASDNCTVHVMDASAFTHVLEESPGLQESVSVLFCVDASLLPF